MHERRHETPSGQQQMTDHPCRSAASCGVRSPYPSPAPGVADQAGPEVPTDGETAAAAGGSPSLAGAPRRRLRRRSLREERVHPRFSPQEMEDVRRAAAACRMTPGGYVAAAGLAAARAENPEAAVADYRRTVKELMESNRQAAAVGNNLNQLAYHLNRSGGPLPEQAAIHRLSERVDDMLEAIDQAVESLVRS
jgi:hypothetical protein